MGKLLDRLDKKNQDLTSLGINMTDSMMAHKIDKSKSFSSLGPNRYQQKRSIHIKPKFEDVQGIK